MSTSYTPPPGPPPPTVPDGWKAQYDERYQTWFFVNLATGKSQWELPKPPALPAGTASSEPPPSYDQAGPPDPTTAATTGDKKRPLGSNNPYNSTGPSQDKSGSTIDSDAQLAARLQAEEDARVSNSGSRDPAIPGSAADYYGESSRPQPASSSTPGPSALNSMPEQKSRSKGGFLSKLMGKSSSNSRPRPQYASYPQQPPPNTGYQDPNYRRYQQQPAPGYGYPAAGYGGYPQQAGGYYQQQPQRKHGMGTAGAAALGVGGGLLGGLLLADAVEDLDDHHDYDNDNGPGDSGWDDGGGGFDGGGDFGGGDF